MGQNTDDQMARAQAMGLVFRDPSGVLSVADSGKLKAWFGADRDQLRITESSTLSPTPSELDERASFQALFRARNAALERAKMISFGVCPRELVEDNIVSEAELRGMGWVPTVKGWRAPDKARDRPVAAKPSIRPLLVGIGEYLTPPPRSPRPECMTDWVPASLYASVVAERDDARAESDQLINAMRDNAVVPFFEYDNEISCLVKEMDEAVRRADEWFRFWEEAKDQMSALKDQLVAKDARIAELKSELAMRPAAFVNPEMEPAKLNPFREHKSDPRRMGPL